MCAAESVCHASAAAAATCCQACGPSTDNFQAKLFSGMWSSSVFSNSKFPTCDAKIFQSTNIFHLKRIGRKKSQVHSGTIFEPFETKLIGRGEKICIKGRTRMELGRSLLCVRCSSSTKPSGRVSPRILPSSSLQKSFVLVHDLLAQKFRLTLDALFNIAGHLTSAVSIFPRPSSVKLQIASVFE